MIIKISPPSIPSGVFRGSTAGLPWVERTSTPPKKGTIVKIFLPKSLTSETNQAPCAKLLFFYMRKLVYINYF